MLNSYVPGIQGRQPHPRGPYLWVGLIVERDQTITWNGWEWIGRSGLIKRINRPLIAVIERLVHKNWKVLGHSVAEERAKDSDVKAATVTHADYRLWSHLIGNSESRSKIRIAVIDITVAAIRPETSHSIGSLFKSCKTAAALLGDGFREVNLPAQPIGNRQLGCGARRVLPIEEPALLAFSGAASNGRICKISAKAGHIAQQERRQRQSADVRRRRCRVGIEGELSCTVGIAGNSQIL